MDSAFKYRPLFAEDIQKVSERGVVFFQDLITQLRSDLSEHPQPLALVVSHGRFILEMVRAMRTEMDMSVPDVFDDKRIMANTAVTVVEVRFGERTQLICKKAFSAKHLEDENGKVETRLGGMIKSK